MGTGRTGVQRWEASAVDRLDLPTPVGPANRRAACGREGSFRPVRARCTARAAAATASSWPTTSADSCRGSRRSLTASSCESRSSGIPVHADTTCMHAGACRQSTLPARSAHTPSQLVLLHTALPAELRR